MNKISIILFLFISLLCLLKLSLDSPQIQRSIQLRQQNEQFLSNWIKNLQPFIGNLTLLDISLPGSHDTLSYDLSTTVSDRANDIPVVLAYLLNHYGHYIPQLGYYIRQQGKTQGLDITAQLNSGLRFVDFRVIYTRNLNESVGENSQDWYSLHLLQTYSKAIHYFQQIRDWLEINDQEILVIWISKHGNECANGSDQYPFVSKQVKQKFWNQIKSLFNGILFDSSKNRLNETTINQLLSKNQRVVIYAADYQEFTGSDPLALDSCLIENQGGGDVTDEVNAYNKEIAMWKNASTHKQITKSQNKFWLQQLAAGTPSKKYEYTVLMEAFGGKKYLQPCADLYNIPNSSFCPVRLQDEGQLTNYYKQLSFDYSSNMDYEFSNAIYLDAVDVDGTFRTGYKYFGPSPDKQNQLNSDNHQTQKYAYMWVLIKSNLQKFCLQNPSSGCQTMKSFIQSNIDKYPKTVWADPAHGRLDNWPVKQQ